MTKFLNDTGLGTLISLIKGEINDKKSIYIGTSPSGDAAKKDKTATVDTFPTVTENNVTKPKTGTIVGIKFLATNTYKTANNTYTLNVNSTGAYPMYYNNAELATSTSANTLVAGYKNRYCYYIFNGTQWVWLGAGYDTNSTYSAMTQAEITAGTGTTGRLLTPALLRSNFYTESEVDAKLPLVVNFTESNDVVTCDTSIADIYAAYSAGREVFGRYNAEGQLNLMLCAYGIVTFSNAFGNSIAQVMGIVENNTDTWTNNPITLQEQLTFDSTPTLGSSRPVTSEGIKVALNAKQDTLTFDSTPTANSTNPVYSGGVYTALSGKQDKGLIVNITWGNTITADKTYTEILAAYNAGRTITLTDEGGYVYSFIGEDNGTLQFSSQEYDAINTFDFLWINSNNTWGHSGYNFQLELNFDNSPIANSNNPVKSGGVYTALQGKQNTLVSGTNIKTVNSQTLLGSGDILLNAATIGTSPSGNYDGDPIEEVLDEKQDSLVSGTNIKTVNNNSLLGSGDVQVGDITGEELETEIEELESTLLTDALRKSEQVLLPAEKTQVLTNLGIADVAKESNLKTINGASIVGTGNIEVLSVNAGDIDVMQATGTSTTGVMSQKAVTEYGRKLLDEEAADGSGAMMREILTSLGWEFNKYTQAGGNLAPSTNTVVTPYIEIGECGNHVIEAAYFLGAAANRYVVFFNSNKTSVTYFQQYENYRYFHTLGDVSTKYVRYTVHVDRIRDCYIYDHTAKQFLFKGDEYLDNIINNYNVSYGYIGDKNVLKHTFIKPTCFSGTLCYYKLSQFPNLDPRTCDGLSVALDGFMSSSSWGSLPFLVMRTGGSNYSNGNYFAIASNWSTIKCGVLTNYYNTVVNGCSLTGNERTKFAHLVITFDFKTGTITSYNNGVLVATNTPETYSESDLRTLLDSCTELYLSWGLKTSCMAVFPYVLTSDDVKSIYGIGTSSTKGELIPDIWNANILHPQTYSGQNIGIYLHNTNIVRSNEGNAAVLTSNSTTAQFGFTGIQGTINNHIYEWDMEVVSGTWTQYSRGMIYNNNNYKVVNIYDSNRNDVSYNDLTIGNYHVVCKPNNILVGYPNAGWNQLNYIFTTTEGAVMKITNLKVVEKGAALICGVNNFRGNYFEQKNSNKVPITREFYPYGSAAFADYYTTYKEDIIEYSSSTSVQFTGQMAVDITNNKVYVGYLTGAGTGTWKQINNS